MNINIGCGEDVKEGYLNVDRLSGPGIDVSHDLNIIPYPFAPNSADEIYASHILEHLDRPFEVMKEFHRILKNGGRLIIKVPHFSRGFTHSEHVRGFDVSFPLYFQSSFTKSGYMGFEFSLQQMRFSWLAFFHLYKHCGISRAVILPLKVCNWIVSSLANLSPFFCSRIWCFWVGGFDEIEFQFRCVKK